MNSALQILGYGAWNGGTLTDNSMYENKGMFFKNDVPVTNETILERIGIRTRMVAPEDVRIGTIALEDLVENNDFDPARIKLIIGATNVGDDKFDPGPLIRYPFDIIKYKCPSAIAFDLYAGCPGFNVAVELAFMLSLNGVLQPGDISIIIGAENIHRARAFPPDDTANIIFGDDALATALRTHQGVQTAGQCPRMVLYGYLIRGPGSYLSSPTLVAPITSLTRERSVSFFSTRFCRAVTPMRSSVPAALRVRTPILSSMVLLLTGIPPLNCNCSGS